MKDDWDTNKRQFSYSYRQFEIEIEIIVIVKLPFTNTSLKLMLPSWFQFCVILITISADLNFNSILYVQYSIVCSIQDIGAEKSAGHFQTFSNVKFWYIYTCIKR